MLHVSCDLAKLIVDTLIRRWKQRKSPNNLKGTTAQRPEPASADVSIINWSPFLKEGNID